MHIINKRNVTLAIISLLILFVVALLIGNFTYSYVGADISDDVTNQGETTATGDTIIFSSGNKLSLHATTDNFNATSSNLTDTTNPSVRLVASSKTNNANATYYAGIRILENSYTYSTAEQTAEVILTVRDETGAIVTASSDTLPYVTVNGVSGFDITGKTGAFNIVIEHPINTTSSTTGTTHTWEFTLTFVNLETDQSINENANLDMDVVLQRDKVNDTLTSYIKNVVYTEDGVNGLYLHDGVGTYTNASEEAGDNSYRYSGANPNNYVCFGSDEATCPDDNLYRIIGVFDDKVKLIKTTSYGNYAWDANGLNNWSTSTLKTELNTNYFNSLGNYADLIDSDAVWYLGGSATNGMTPKVSYDFERGSSVASGNPVEDTHAIGLVYPSDYGYAAGSNYWGNAIYSNNPAEDYRAAISDNWLFSGLYEWSIMHLTSAANVFLLYADGSMYSSVVTNECSVRPVFYLNADVELVSGTGTQTDPFRVA